MFKSVQYLFFLFLQKPQNSSSMKKLILSFILLLTPFSGVIIAQNEYVPSPENLESRQQFAQDRFGIFIHWGIYSMLANKEWVMQHQGLEFNEYSQIAGGVFPSKFNAEEWVKVFGYLNFNVD